MKKAFSTGTGSAFTVAASGLILTLLALTALACYFIKDKTVILWGLIITAAALGWLWVLLLLLRRKMWGFTDDICSTLDRMMSGEGKPEKLSDEESIFAKVHYRLLRLYETIEENRHKVDKERKELQSLVSDISHQVKTPVSNMKMLIDTLLAKDVLAEEREEFLQGIRAQTEKLDFLFGAMVKSSRLETGLIQLNPKSSRMYDTLAQALSGILYSAEQKSILVEVDCPEWLRGVYDSKWTSEAIFNLLDNAVKYTEPGGKITVTAEDWEMHIRISVHDTGKGISEDKQAAIFRRFYREEEVHTVQGVGIGLHLAREIITRQGGYIKLVSSEGKGSTFSVFLPKR